MYRKWRSHFVLITYISPNVSWIFFVFGYCLFISGFGPCRSIAPVERHDHLGYHAVIVSVGLFVVSHWIRANYKTSPLETLLFAIFNRCVQLHTWGTQFRMWLQRLTPLIQNTIFVSITVRRRSLSLIVQQFSEDTSADARWQWLFH